MEQKRTTYWWYCRYMDYCIKHKIDFPKQTYKEYTETMKKVEEWVNKNDLLSQN